jgi:integrase
MNENGGETMARVAVRGDLPNYFKKQKKAVVYKNGKRIVLGDWPNFPDKPSPEVIAKYLRFKADELLGNDSCFSRQEKQSFTVSMLCVEAIDWAKNRYRNSNEAANIRLACGSFLELWPDLPLDELRPFHLIAIQKRLIGKGHSRTGTNRRINQIKRVIRFGVKNGFIEPPILLGVQTVDALLPGDSQAIESRPRGAVSDSDVEATIPFLSERVAALVRFQRLTGCRPGEAVRLNMAEIEQISPSAWVYKPRNHKTAWRGKERIIPIGPKGIELITPWLRPEGGYLFQPRESLKKLPNWKRAPGCFWRVSSYTHAIARACGKAGIPIWSPNQLRKAKAQEIRDKFGLEAAAAALGNGVGVNDRHYSNQSIGPILEVAKATG